MRTGISKILALLVLAASAFAEGRAESDARYERVSLCQFMVSYPQKTYFRELEQEYTSLPFPNRFNNHFLGVNFIKFASEEGSAASRIDFFLKDAQVAKKCVAKWFGRTKAKGTFSVELLQERGFYNATATDARTARLSHRGEAALGDGGERLLGYTFVAVHDFEPQDGERSKAWKLNRKLKDEDPDEPLQLSDSTVRAEYNKQYHNAQGRKGSYKIKCTTHLYRLVWDDEVAARFYSELYTEQADEALRRAFDSERGLFRLEKAGEYSTTLEVKRDKRIKSNEQLVKTALARVMDRNLAGLQTICPAFRVKAPLTVAEDGTLTSEIGMKEDIAAGSLYEVVEREEDESGKISYNRVGIVRAAQGRVWDNRFNAYDQADGRDDNGLTATTFETVEGKDFYSGLLLRKIVE